MLCVNLPVAPGGGPDENHDERSAGGNAPTHYEPRGVDHAANDDLPIPHDSPIKNCVSRLVLMQLSHSMRMTMKLYVITWLERKVSRH
jgi:hypothetical protein